MIHIKLIRLNEITPILLNLQLTETQLFCLFKSEIIISNNKIQVSVFDAVIKFRDIAKLIKLKIH